MCVCLHVFLNVYIYICNHENKVPSRLSPQWLCSNSCTWAHDVRLGILRAWYITVWYITLILLL